MSKLKEDQTLPHLTPDEMSTDELSTLKDATDEAGAKMQAAYDAWHAAHVNGADNETTLGLWRTATAERYALLRAALNRALS